MSFLLSTQSRLLGLVVGSTVLWTIESLLPLYSYEKHRLRRLKSQVCHLHRFTFVEYVPHLVVHFPRQVVVPIRH